VPESPSDVLDGTVGALARTAARGLLSSSSLLVLVLAGVAATEYLLSAPFVQVVADVLGPAESTAMGMAEALASLTWGFVTTLVFEPFLLLISALAVRSVVQGGGLTRLGLLREMAGRWPVIILPFIALEIVVSLGQQIIFPGLVAAYVLAYAMIALALGQPRNVVRNLLRPLARRPFLTAGALFATTVVVIGTPFAVAVSMDGFESASVAWLTNSTHASPSIRVFTSVWSGALTAASYAFLTAIYLEADTPVRRGPPQSLAHDPFAPPG
jgi:hypothetical protein